MKSIKELIDKVIEEFVNSTPTSAFTKGCYRVSFDIKSSLLKTNKLILRRYISLTLQEKMNITVQCVYIKHKHMKQEDEDMSLCSLLCCCIPSICFSLHSTMQRWFNRNQFTITICFNKNNKQLAVCKQYQ